VLHIHDDSRHPIPKHFPIRLLQYWLCNQELFVLVLETPVQPLFYNPRDLFLFEYFPKRKTFRFSCDVRGVQPRRPNKRHRAQCAPPTGYFFLGLIEQLPVPLEIRPVLFLRHCHLQLLAHCFHYGR
jgi:hypothetical protein